MTNESVRPLVTIAIASCDDEARIEACLRIALSQDYPRELVEIIVADSMSMDSTRETVLRVADSDSRLRMIDNPKRTRAAALNAILCVSSGEIVVPMDPGGEYGRTHVTKCVEALATSPAEHLAIVPRTAGRTLIERALSAAQRTKLAFVTGSELVQDSNLVPTMLGAVRRRVFHRIGLLDPATNTEEEVELLHRIEEAGGGSLVRRDIVVHKAEARSFRELLSKHYLLGRSRARRAVKERRIPSMRAFGPLAIVLAGSALAMTSSVQPITPIALACYALVTGASAVRVARGEGFATMPIAWAAYPVMHLAHGVGFGSGLVRAIVRPDWEPSPRLEDAVIA